ncbi:MAG: hypothetical protein SPG15_10715 [Hornefia butyriciproducens]|nr:hypothetical protein [Clostridiales bacterium]MDY5464088.1 hypothetical protein [Hornefia butyriciproducens]
MNCSNSIHQIAMDLGRKIIKRTENGEIQDLDLMAKDIAEDCRTSARAMVEATLKYLNESIREDKSERKQRNQPSDGEKPYRFRKNSRTRNEVRKSCTYTQTKTMSICRNRRRRGENEIRSSRWSQ